MKSVTTLTITNRVEGKLLVRMEVSLGLEESIIATIPLEKSDQERSIRQIERAVFARLAEISNSILREA
jgi:hypothetical protein